MNRIPFLTLVVAVLALAGCGNDNDNTMTGSQTSGSPTDASVIESQQREVTFSVPDMSCPMCPITVRKALAGVDGVVEAEASLDDKQARVVFDPAKTSIDALVAAVAEAGFTATPNGDANG